MKSSSFLCLILSCCLIIPLSQFSFFQTAQANFPWHAFEGGGSDGGGNSYRGRPLDSYIVFPMEMPAFRATVRPVLEDLQRKAESDHRMDLLRNLIFSVFAQKTWYLLPGPLDPISSELPGFPVQTDQAVLQNFHRVWLDQNIWEKMSLQDQGLLLLHEAVMGLKILRFASSQDQCRAAYAESNTCGRQDSSAGVIRLKAGDYLDVQRMTATIARDFVTLTSDSWIELLQKNNIRFGFDWFESENPFSRKEFQANLAKANLSNYLPTYGFNYRIAESMNFSSSEESLSFMRKNQEPCQINAVISGSSLSLELVAASEKFHALIPIPEIIDVTRYDDLFLEERILHRVPAGFTSPQPNPRGGFIDYNIWLAFDGYRLASVFLQEMVCATEDCRSGSVDVKNGLSYICSDNQNLLGPK